MPSGVLSFYTPNKTSESSCFPIAASTELWSYLVPKKSYPCPGIQLVLYTLPVFRSSLRHSPLRGGSIEPNVYHTFSPHMPNRTLHLPHKSRASSLSLSTQMCKPEIWGLFLPSQLLQSFSESVTTSRHLPSKYLPSSCISSATTICPEPLPQTRLSPFTPSLPPSTRSP